MEQIKIKDIVYPDWNFKNVDAGKFKSLEKSIRENGQTKNIIVRKLKSGKYEIIDGRNVFKILSQMDRDYVHCFVYHKTKRKKAMLLYLQHDFKFQNNFVLIAQALVEINMKVSKIDIEKCIPYNYSEVEELLTLSEFDFARFKIEKASEQSILF